MPTYKRLTYIREALESALCQTYSNFEVLVSDNEPSDAVAELVASYGDSRLRYRHNGTNIGPMGNALAAYRAARGTYVGTLHDDDAWEPTFLERLVPVLEHDSTLSLAFADHWIMGPDGVVDGGATELNTRRWNRHRLEERVYRPFHRLALVDRAVPIAMSTILRKSAIDWNDFPDEMSPVYDLWIAYLASRDGQGAYYCPARLTRYRLHGDSVSAQQRSEAAHVFCYSRFISDHRLQSIRPDLVRASAPFYTDLGISLLQAGQRASARRNLSSALRRGPEPRALAALILSWVPVGEEWLVSQSRRILHRLRRVRLPTRSFGDRQ
jgi:glycosyltransferase involved in cell wall biosynthesis